MSKRRRFSAEFKARVALDALSGELTLSELASKYKIHPNQVSTWKRQAKDQIVDGFSGKAKSRQTNSEDELKDLHAKGNYGDTLLNYSIFNSRRQCFGALRSGCILLGHKVALRGSN